MDKLYPLIEEDHLPSLAKQFQHELIAALSNQSSSLPSILNPIDRMSMRTGYGVAVSIGGTNGYVSDFRVDAKGVMKFLHREFFTLPVKTTKQDLFHLITKYVFKVTNGRRKPFPIGIGLAYPLKPLLHHGFIDGMLIGMSKGRTIDGLVGKKVGRQYHRFLIKNYGIDTSVAVANDAICLLLGGGKADLAGVVGTGLNFAYWDKREKIAPMKLNELAGFGKSEVAINIESASFDKIERACLSRKIDNIKENPKGVFAEKETAGAFLYQIFNAGKKEIISENFPDLTSTDQLNDISTGAFPFDKYKMTVKKQIAGKFAERIFRRSAQIAAIQICGIFLKIGRTKGIIPVVMEGGLFWKANNYNTLVNYYINMILPEAIPSFARIFGSSRRGIAILSLNRGKN